MGIWGLRTFLLTSVYNSPRLGAKLMVDRVHRQPFDHVYIDFNATVHECFETIMERRKLMEKTNPNTVASEKPEDYRKWFFHDMSEEVYQMMNMIVQTFPPRKSVFVALDGPATLSKLLLQRKRREHMETLRVGITVGTDLMLEMDAVLCRWAKQFTHRFPHVQAVISPSTTVGEGEHKIGDRLMLNNYRYGHLPHRYNFSQSLLRVNAFRNSVSPEAPTHLMISPDSDAMLIGLTSMCPNVTICFRFNERQSLSQHLAVRKTIQKNFFHVLKTKDMNIHGDNFDNVWIMLPVDGIYEYFRFRINPPGSAVTQAPAPAPPKPSASATSLPQGTLPPLPSLVSAPNPSVSGSAVSVPLNGTQVTSASASTPTPATTPATAASSSPLPPPTSPSITSSYGVPPRKTRLSAEERFLLALDCVFAVSMAGTDYFPRVKGMSVRYAVDQFAVLTLTSAEPKSAGGEILIRLKENVSKFRQFIH